MSYGYNGKILKINLTEKKYEIATPSDLFYRRYMGGRAFAAYYLLKELEPGVDPLSPDNILIFAASVLTGAPAPGIPRFTVAAKSPMTGGFGESEAGGSWGPQLKRSGFDAVIIKGKAASPVYLYINDGEVKIKDAGHLWGQPVAMVETLLKEELNNPKIKVVTIGIGGEKQVRYACILNEASSANGRNGFGAVMGSKNLKAIAVSGTGSVNLFDKEAVKDVSKWVASIYRDNPISATLNEYGTPAAIAGLQASGMLPTDNFSFGEFSGHDKIDGDTLKKKYVGKKPCYACPIACKKQAKIDDERFSVDSVYGSPEYETLASFGSNLGINDLNVIIKANELSNKYGIDTISMGVTIAFARECFINGLLSKEDTDGIDFTFAEPTDLLKVIEKVAHRDGFGNLLSEGCMRLARKLGNNSEDLAVQCKGLELPMHDPRAKFIVALGYAVAVAGPDHMSIPHDVFYETQERINNNGLDSLSFYEPVTNPAKKVKAAVYGQTLWSLYNVLGVCDFAYQPRGIISFDKLVKLVKGITGFNTNMFDLMEVGRRAINLARMFNVREGFTTKDDKLPAMAYGPIKEGRLKGAKIDKKQFAESLQEYYQLMGWNPETGIPYASTLKALDIEWVLELINK